MAPPAASEVLARGPLGSRAVSVAIGRPKQLGQRQQRQREPRSYIAGGLDSPLLLPEGVSSDDMEIAAGDRGGSAISSVGHAHVVDSQRRARARMPVKPGIGGGNPGGELR